MGELSGEPLSDNEFDFEYEYDAPQFYDFSRLETESEAVEADLWFQSAVTYKASPLIAKLKWKYEAPKEHIRTSLESKANENSKSITEDNNRESDSEIPKSKTKPPVKLCIPKSSTSKKPTVHSSPPSKRLEKSIVSDDKSPQSSSLIRRQATKKQKLEAGYLFKIARLKHQAHFLHKVAKKAAAHNANKVTISKEPELETQHKAERRRSKVSGESPEQVKPISSNLQARPLNKKILETSRSLPKQSMNRRTEFQVFNLKTSERAMQRAVNYAGVSPPHIYFLPNKTVGSKTRSSTDAKKESCKDIHKFKDSHVQNRKSGSFDKKDCKLQADKKLQNEACTVSCNKLSQSTEAQTNMKNIHAEISNMLKKKPPMYQGKHYQCGSDRRTTGMGTPLHINRSLSIC